MAETASSVKIDRDNVRHNLAMAAGEAKAVEVVDAAMVRVMEIKVKLVRNCCG